MDFAKYFPIEKSRRRRWSGLLLAACALSPGATAQPGAELQAEEALMTACELDRAQALAEASPDHPDALRLLGRIKIARDQFTEAVQLLEQAVAKQPDSAETHFHLGEARLQYAAHAPLLKKFGLAGGARDAYLRAVELDPNTIKYRAPLVTYYGVVPGNAGGNMKKARAQVAAIARLDPLEGRYQEAYLTALDEREEEARKLLEKLAELGHIQAAVMFAQLSAKAELPAPAFAALNKVLEAQPHSLMAQYAFGLVASMTGKEMARGEALLKAYLGDLRNRCEPNAKITRAAVHYSLGEIYRKSGRIEDARRAYTASLEQFPDFKQAEDALKSLPKERVS